MVELKVIWTKRALAVFQKTAYWYAANLGIQFAATFAKNVDELEIFGVVIFSIKAHK